jgi:hypothetical protein
MLKIATLDGTRVTSVQKFGYAGSGAWNPLPLSVPSSQGPAATASRSSVAPLIYTIAALGVLGLLVLAWRARRKTGAS